MAGSHVREDPRHGGGVDPLLFRRVLVHVAGAVGVPVPLLRRQQRLLGAHGLQQLVLKSHAQHTERHQVSNQCNVSITSSHRTKSHTTRSHTRSHTRRSHTRPHTRSHTRSHTTISPPALFCAVQKRVWSNWILDVKQGDSNIPIHRGLFNKYTS